MMTKLFNRKLLWRTARCGVAAALCLMGDFGSQKLFSQTAPVSYRTPNRWLLIVETSRTMQPRAEAAAQIAGNLLLSEMTGQLRPGDTLGLWTFNGDLHAGGFPLQLWSPENGKVITERVAAFLAKQKFEGRPGRDQVFPAMNSVISNSEFITVILITSGGETFSGTPFDKVINAIHKQWAGQQEKARQPFLTMLRAQRGRITDFEVGRPPGPLEFPPLPPELLVTNPVVVAPARPPPAPPAPIVPNLIVHGKKPEPVEELVSNAPPTTMVATQLPAIVEFKTNPPTAPPVSIATNTSPATNSEIAASPAGSSTNQPAATEKSGGGKTFWIAGLIGFGAAAGLAWVLVRRSRSRSRVSLITRSLERDNK